MASIQGRANKDGEYHKNPITMVAMAATNTWQQLDAHEFPSNPPHAKG
jgi:hypothetical protein